jgi:hypothetical protein
MLNSRSGVLIVLILVFVGAVAFAQLPSARGKYTVRTGIRTKACAWDCGLWPSIAGKGFGARTRRLRESQTKPDPGNPLYSWSKIRDEQLSSESAASAQTYPGGAGSWHGPAWYWNPWSASYTFLSASGFVTGPFGWPYYSPGYAPDYVPVHRGGDSWPYGPPVLTGPEPMRMPGPSPINRPPAVPLTAPGVPGFPNNRFR